ncbi:MAG: pyruvate formate lyase family protein, partial [Oscillospiraceae bacterium]|nr:pyruvate formate lyase family protein [Oscillospiraceae bacterium]
MKINKEEIKGVQVLTPRLQKLKGEWESAEPQVYVDDTLLFTESWKETEGLPVDIRWAKALEKRLLECPLMIRDGELLAGSLTKFIRGNGTLCAMKPREIMKMVESGKFDRKSSDISSTNITPEDLDALRADAAYWIEHMPKVSAVNAAVAYEMSEEYPQVFDLLFDRGMVFEGRGVRYEMDRGLFQNYSAYGGGVAQVSVKCVEHGLNYVIDLCKKERERMMAEGDENSHGTAQFLRKFWLLKAAIISCEAFIAYAKRYADLAREMAIRSSDPVRRAELNRIADACERVPGEPPRDFFEAVQCVRLYHLVCWKESSDRPEVPIGRLDQLLYPYYKQDKEAGKITAQDAAELLGSLWLKIRETENLVTIPRELRAAPGSLLPNITLCGRDENGNDLTNEVSWLVLEAMAQIKLSEPAIYVRYHDKMDPEFIIHALECNREFGGGNPAFLNDELGTKRYLDRGVPISDACNWNASGCLGYHLDSMEHMGGGHNISQLKVLELALNDGFDPRTQKQLGPHTGNPRTFTSYEQVYNAYLEQLKYFVPILRKLKMLTWATEIADGPMSGLRVAMQYEDCIPAGLASREGGARYPEGRACWLGSRGLVDLSDTLAGIKKVVFTDKKATMAELMDACAKNWEGYETLHQLCVNAPKYGNDDDFADEIYDKISKDVPEIMQSEADPLTGKKPMLFIGAAAGHVGIGKAIGAMPSGRNAGDPTCDAAASVSPGCDVNGPTAAINSATNDVYGYPYAGFA